MRVPLFFERLIQRQVEKELKMAKKKLFVTKKDGYTPTMMADGLLSLKSPLEYFVPPEREVIVDFGFTADKALLTVKSVGSEQSGISCESALLVFPAGTQVVARYKNNTKSPVKIYAGDTILRAAVLDSSDTVVETK